MGYAVGIALAVVVFAFARITRFDRDRAFYPTTALVVAHYYVLFAVMGGGSRTLVLESLVMSVFVLCAVAAFRHGQWLAMVVIAAHGVLDFFHAGLLNNAGVPAYWPAFCLSFDLALPSVLAGAYFAGSFFGTAPKVSSVT